MIICLKRLGCALSVVSRAAQLIGVSTALAVVQHCKTVAQLTARLIERTLSELENTQLEPFHNAMQGLINTQLETLT